MFSRCVVTFIGISFLLAVLPGCSMLYDRLGGPYKGGAADAYRPGGLSADARRLIDAAFNGFQHQSLYDHHVHFFGNGETERYSFCPGLDKLPADLRPTINFERITQHQDWYERPFFTGVFLDAVDVSDIGEMDEQYMKRLVELAAFYGPPSHVDNPQASPYTSVFMLYAMDAAYGADGSRDKHSFNYVSNQFVLELSRCLNERIRASDGFIHNRFEAVGSVNPMRKAEHGVGYVMRERDAWMAELDYLAQHEIRWIKWRPSSMALDPLLVSEAFYRELRSRGIGILTHTGKSKGLDLGEALDDLAAPRRMRKALDAGVDVVLLHAGRAGGVDGGASYYQEFVDLLQRYAGSEARVYGELSAVPYKDTAAVFEQILQDDFVLDRMLNASDYPAVTPHIYAYGSLKDLFRRGWLTRTDFESLDEVLHYNPLLFDFVLKRTLSIDGRKLPPRIFLGTARH